MPHSQIDTTIERAVVGEFAFPLGATPVGEITPRPGWVVEFESADGADAAGEWEEWPDRYAFEIVVSASRLRPLCRSLFSLLPLRVYPILDALGSDAYREVDPYIAYDPVGLDRFLSEIRRHGDWLYEDGLVGFGAMSVDPFIYVFIDEHKIVTVRVQTTERERVDRILQAFEVREDERCAGVDAAAHEHRTVLYAPDDRPDLMSTEELVEELCDEWRLKLNIDRSTNVDEAGRPLGVTPWRCIIRLNREEVDAVDYAEALLTADCLEEVEKFAWSIAESRLLENGAKSREEDGEWMVSLITADRLTTESFKSILEEAREEGIAPKSQGVSARSSGVHAVRWLRESAHDSPDAESKDGGGEEA